VASFGPRQTLDVYLKAVGAKVGCQIGACVGSEVGTSLEIGLSVVKFSKRARQAVKDRMVNLIIYLVKK